MGSPLSLVVVKLEALCLYSFLVVVKLEALSVSGCSQIGSPFSVSGCRQMGSPLSLHSGSQMGSPLSMVVVKWEAPCLWL